MKFLIAGGGTGGHIYPALAILEGIARAEPGAEFVYVGVKGKSEEELLPKYIAASDRSIVFRVIRGAGLPRSKNPFRWIKFLILFAAGCIESLLLLLRTHPDRIVATGGFVSVPLVLTGRVLNIPAYLHEQNAIPGIANTFCARFVQKIFISFRETGKYFPEQKIEFTGYPVRKSIRLLPSEEAKIRLGFSPHQKVILFFGGSLGARTINDAVISLLPVFLKQESVGVIHGVGRNRSKDYHAFRETTRQLQAIGIGQSVPGKYLYRDYFDDMQLIYSAADVIVARSGAGSVMEIASIGKPSVLIPKRNFRGGHQTANAGALVTEGVAKIVEEYLEKGKDRVNPQQLIREVNHFLQGLNNGSSAGEAYKKIFINDAAERIAAVLCRRDIFHVLSDVGGIESPDADQYRLQIDEGFGSSNWKKRNAAVKLIGAVGDISRLPLLAQIITDRTPASLLDRLLGGDFKEVGFIRRNAVRALAAINRFTPDVHRVVLAALTDPYFEVRSAAAQTGAILYPQYISERSEFVKNLKPLLKDSHFDVRIEAIKSIGLLADSKEVVDDLMELRYHPNNRVRMALVNSLKRLHRRSIISEDKYRLYRAGIFIPGGVYEED